VVVTATNEQYKTKKRWHIKESEGLEIHRIFLPFGNHLSYIQRTFVFLKFMWFATFRLLKIKADLVLATSTPLTIGIPAMLKKWIHKTPYIFEVRDVWPEAVIAIGAVKNRWMRKWLYFQEKIIYKNADYIVPLSIDMQKSIITRFPSFERKTDVVIENISEINRFQSLDIIPVKLEEILGIKPRFTVLYAGTFGRVNGIEYVINLAEKTLMIDTELVYILIGSGGEKEKINIFAKEKGVLNKNVFILDPISKDELPSWYRSVDMGSSFVIDVKELWVNSANKFFDSLAAGKPILINHRGWQAEVIDKNNIGYVLPETLNEKEIQIFLDYTRDLALHKEQALNSYEQAKSSYSLQVAIHKYITIFDKIIR
jgi:glycosyltransferase involved in cell wall biosynthesis